MFALFVSKLVVCVAAIQCVDCDEDSGQSPKLARRKTAVGSMVHRPLALPFADISKGFHADSTWECGCNRRFLRVQRLENVESEPCASRGFLFVRSLDDALRTCNRIVHIPASRSPSHFCAPRIIASKSGVLDSLLGLAFVFPSISGRRKG